MKKCPLLLLLLMLLCACSSQRTTSIQQHHQSVTADSIAVQTQSSSTSTSLTVDTLLTGSSVHCEYSGVEETFDTLGRIIKRTTHNAIVTRNDSAQRSVITIVADTTANSTTMHRTSTTTATTDQSLHEQSTTNFPSVLQILIWLYMLTGVIITIYLIIKIRFK